MKKLIFIGTAALFLASSVTFAAQQSSVNTSEEHSKEMQLAYNDHDHCHKKCRACHECSEHGRHHHGYHHGHHHGDHYNKSTTGRTGTMRPAGMQGNPGNPGMQGRPGMPGSQGQPIQ
jgi:hypothetical protein